MYERGPGWKYRRLAHFGQNVSQGLPMKQSSELNMIASIDSTAAARTVDSNLWDEVGETFIREMDNAQITLKLNTAGKDSKEDVQAELTTSLRHLLEKCLDHQGVLELVNDKHPEQAVITSRINLRAKFIPVPIQLELRETSLSGLCIGQATHAD